MASGMRMTDGELYLEFCRGAGWRPIHTPAQRCAIVRGIRALSPDLLPNELDGLDPRLAEPLSAALSAARKAS